VLLHALIIALAVRSGERLWSRTLAPGDPALAGGGGGGGGGSRVAYITLPPAREPAMPRQTTVTPPRPRVEPEPVVTPPVPSPTPVAEAPTPSPAPIDTQPPSALTAAATGPGAGPGAGGGTGGGAGGGTGPGIGPGQGPGTGPGAGGAATSSAVLGDLVAIARGGRSTWAGLAAAEGTGRARRPGAGETFDAPSGTRYPVLR